MHLMLKRSVMLSLLRILPPNQMNNNRAFKMMVRSKQIEDIKLGALEFGHLRALRNGPKDAPII